MFEIKWGRSKFFLPTLSIRFLSWRIVKLEKILRKSKIDPRGEKINSKTSQRQGRKSDLLIKNMEKGKDGN